MRIISLSCNGGIKFRTKSSKPDNTFDLFIWVKELLDQSPHLFFTHDRNSWPIPPSIHAILITLLIFVGIRMSSLKTLEGEIVPVYRRE